MSLGGWSVFFDLGLLTPSIADPFILPPPQDGYETLWIESICEDPGVIAHNVAQLREASPDYVADHDFERRIAFYKKDYVHVEVGAGCGVVGQWLMGPVSAARLSFHSIIPPSAF